MAWDPVAIGSLCEMFSGGTGPVPKTVLEQCCSLSPADRMHAESQAA